MRRRLRCGVRCAVAIALVHLVASAAHAQTLDRDPCDVRTSERIVAVGDIHGAYDPFTAILRDAALIDGRDRWIGGRAVLVQTGDILDRGPDSRKVLDLLRRLERDAARAGGRVYSLLGNHEVMRMIDDWRYVSAGELEAFRTPQSGELRDAVLATAAENAQARARDERRPFDRTAFREQFLKDVPLGFLEMRQAFSPDGEYGRWLRGRVAMVIINGTAFVHGGVSPEIAVRGCRGINAAVAADLRVRNPTPQQGATMFSSSDTGPLWYRGLTDDPTAISSPQLTGVLDALGAHTLVIGHTVTPSFTVTSRYEGRVVQIDTGMLGGDLYKGGTASALVLHGGTATALHAGQPPSLLPDVTNALTAAARRAGAPLAR